MQASCAAMLDTGLSPRVRGNRQGRGAREVCPGSIPARAGGTISPDPPGTSNTGLSPRVRGNLEQSLDGREILGSIPRVRGNRARGVQRHPGGGSIPARAGEPALRETTGCPDKVYPRACGGTEGKAICYNPNKGLSPRVRGNRPCGPCEPDVPGSIPARAGEPGGVKSACSKQKVYPRACGGTDKKDKVAALDKGLSPRVRGNRVQDQGRKLDPGSIPARAGNRPTRRA